MIVSSGDSGRHWDTRLYEHGFGKVLERRLSIRYLDAEGRTSDREIRTERFFVEPWGDGKIGAYCLMRQGPRTFEISRIRQAVDTQRQRAIPDLAAWLLHEYSSTHEGRAEAFIEAYAPALGVLFAVAKADGAVRTAEWDIVARFVGANCAGDARVQQLVMEELRDWVTPSAVAFGRDLRSLDGLADDLRDELWQAAQEMVASDKTVREAETRALERMRKALGLRAAPKSPPKGST